MLAFVKMPSNLEPESPASPSSPAGESLGVAAPELSNPPQSAEPKGARELAQILYALSDPTRLRIVQILDGASEEMRCGDFYETLGVSKPTLSHHFTVLRDCGVMVTRTDGTRKFNSLSRLEIEGRFPGLLKSVLQALRR